MENKIDKIKVYNLVDVVDKYNHDHQLYGSLDELFIHNNHIKCLVYDYLQNIKDVTTISTLIDMFGSTNSIEFYNSNKFKHYMESDPIYKQTITKFINNQYKWCNGIAEIFGYDFDSKYLLNENYRAWMKSNMDLFGIIGHNFHYSIELSKIKKNSDKYKLINNWFNIKRTHEKTFIDLIFDGIKVQDHILYDVYFNNIEFTDTKTGEHLVIKIQKNMEIDFEIFYKTKSRDSNNNRSDINKIIDFIVKSSFVKKVYDRLRNIDYQNKIKEYLIKIDKLTKNKIFNELNLISTSILNDLANSSNESFVGSELVAVRVGHNTYQTHTISYNKAMSVLTMNRVIYSSKYKKPIGFNKHRYCINPSDPNPKILSEELLMNGLMYYSDSGMENKVNKRLECELISSNKDTNYSGSFMRIPIDDILNNLSTCKKVQNIIISENSNFDQRSVSLHNDVIAEVNNIDKFISLKPTSYLEYKAYKIDTDLFINNWVTNLTKKRLVSEKFNSILSTIK